MAGVPTIKLQVNVPQVLSTGQVAKILRCAPRSVAKWIDAGELVGWRLPVGGDRRVLWSELVKFARRRGIPLAELAGVTIGPDDDPDPPLPPVAEAALGEDEFDWAA